MKELYHHGVKGMKWGVHKAKSVNDTGNKRNNSSSDYILGGRVKKSTAKKVAIGAATVAAVAGVSYAGYKMHKKAHSVGSIAAESVVKNMARHQLLRNRQGQTFLK